MTIHADKDPNARWGGQQKIDIVNTPLKKAQHAKQNKFGINEANEATIINEIMRRIALLEEKINS